MQQITDADQSTNWSKHMENALDELESLMAAMRRLEMNGEFIKAGIVHQLYAELRARYRGEPVGEYWNLS